VKPEQVPALLVALAVIVIATHALGALARRSRQPAVIGEIVMGILAGPTFFGGAIANTLFPPDIRPLLTALADVGVALFMFVIGTELDGGLVKGRGRTTISVALVSTALPFLLGCGLALYLAPRHGHTGEPGFVLFLGVAMSVTAFPVLARILSDRGMITTGIGRLALSSAAIADVLAWTMLAVVVAVVGGGHHSPWLATIIVPFVLVMFLAVRPLLRRLAAGWRPEDTRRRMLVIALAGLMLSGALCEAIGLHFIFGAFLFGVVMPRDEKGASAFADLWQGTAKVSNLLLLPIYFVVAGASVDLSHVDFAVLGDLGLILLVSIGGKFLGTLFAARAHRLEWRSSAALGVLMNTRGLTELIVLTVGLQLGLLDRQLFSLMVVMAVVTTAAAGPLLRLLVPAAGREPEVLPVFAARG
jgi:Kef-type K+ transport system membrane component KefB